MFRLIYKDSSGPASFLLPQGTTIVGRAPTCNLVVQNSTVSRQHAKFDVGPDGCFVQDLGSSLGTYRNGEAIARSEIVDGDVLLMGRVRFDVQKSMDDQVALSDSHIPVTTEGTVFLSVASLTVPTVAGKPDLQTTAVDGRQLLGILSEIGGALVKSTSLADVLDRVVSIAFETIPAERVFLMLTDELTNELIPRVARSRSGKVPQGASISRTIARMVMADRVAMLSTDAQVDSRFEQAHSVVGHSIRSFMCAPLWNRDDVIGILYVDNPKSKEFSGGKDLTLFTALSNYAAVAIEHARLTTRLLEETRRKERLQRYHSPAVVSRILDAGDETEGTFVMQEREVSVLFADLVGFTTIAETMPPLAVAQLLNGFFGVMTEVIFRHEGTLDKFIGDAILAMFGAPLVQPDHALRCVRVAIEMRAVLARLNQDRKEPLRMRIAINSGHALVGDIGSPKRREFTVLGDVVNTASRIESSVTQPDQIVLSGETYRLVKDHIPARSLGSIQLRGRAAAVDVYEV
jgi:adenylate cyclase